MEEKIKILISGDKQTTRIYINDDRFFCQLFSLNSLEAIFIPGERAHPHILLILAILEKLN